MSNIQSYKFVLHEVLLFSVLVLAMQHQDSFIVALLFHIAASKTTLLPLTVSLQAEFHITSRC